MLFLTPRLGAGGDATTKAAAKSSNPGPIQAAGLGRIACPVFTVKIQLTTTDPGWKLETKDAPGTDTSLWTATSYGSTGRKGLPYVVPSSIATDTLICRYYAESSGGDFPAEDTYSLFIRRAAPPERPVCEAQFSEHAFVCRALKPGER